MRYCPACHSVFPNEFRTCPKDQSELRAASELQPGMVLRGKYQVLERVGAGGMAAVYKARHLAFDEVCAIKVVATRLADDDDFLRRFRNEAVVARRFQHPHAVRVDDLDTTEDGRPFIVMEYVDGLNLREVVRRDGALGLRRAVTIARQVASALGAAHEVGIVHRDIKPDNIVLTRAGAAESAKVLDFGIAKVKEGFFGDSAHPATRTGAVVGTPQYISPEQAMGRRGDEIDGRADLYSLGVVLYEMATGRLPFESDTAMGVILQHLQAIPTPPHELRPDLGIPEPLSAVLLRALAKDRETRFRSAAEMISALDEVLALPLPERAAPDTPPSGAAPSTPRPVPVDIDRHETRVMPRTPTATTTYAASSRPTVHLPPLPGTPVPATARIGTPPPLPASGTPTAKGRRRVPPWLKWAGVVLAAYFIFGRGTSTPRRPAAAVAPSAGEPAGAAEDPEQREERIRTEVKKALEDSPVTTDEAIVVDVDDTVVTLGGHVHDRRPAEEADRLARAVAGVTLVSNEIELRAANDHRSVVPRVERVPAVPPPGVPAPAIPVMPPGLDTAIRKWTREVPVAELIREGRKELDRGNPEAALEAFRVALSLDPGNKDAVHGMRDAGRAMQRRVMPPKAPVPSPPADPPDAGN